MADLHAGDWWGEHRRPYRAGVSVSSVLALVVHLALCDLLGIETTLFTVVPMVFGLGLYVLLAWRLYGVGCKAEKVVTPLNELAFRKAVWRLGVALGILVPWVVPILLLIRHAGR